MLEIYDD
jgi:WD40 repeat protein